MTVYFNMESPLIIGDTVRFKYSRLGFGKVVSITPRKRGGIPFYHIETLDGKSLVMADFEFLEKLNPEDSDLVNTLNSVGLL